MQIIDNRLAGVPFTLSPNRSKTPIMPRFIVMHYTAGWTAAPAISWLTNPAAKVSAHLVIDNDGAITQLVPFNIPAWHAGPSTWAGYSDLNRHSIGIEISNPGYLRKLSDGRYQDDAGGIHTDGKGHLAGRLLVVCDAPRVGSGTFYWPTYTKEQFAALDAIVLLLAASYPSIFDVVSHEQIDTRGWKSDPGPAFPLNRYRSMVTSRAAATDAYEVTASSLNLRSGPGTAFGVQSEIPRGARVEVLARSGDWVRIDSDSWVHSAYLRKVS